MPCKDSFFVVKARVAILISDKVDVRARKITKNKEEHYIMLER